MIAARVEPVRHYPGVECEHGFDACPICDAPPPGRQFPAITLWQPWASLIFAGVKRHETRGFRLPDRLVGQWVAVHAAARSVRPAELTPELDAICQRQWGRDYETSLPHRAVVGLCRFAEPYRTEDERRPFADADDIHAGDWSPGRWAWPISHELYRLDPPAKAKGRQGWWKVALEPPPQLGDASPPPTQGGLI